MIVTILLRRGSSAEWASANPVLFSGEPGYDETVHQFKIGDGATHWTELAWAGGGSGGGSVASRAYDSETGWPPRGSADTVLWIGGTVETPPAGSGSDVWLRDLV